jgi:CubicO group peptidase (beta-lactamase class C family)
MIKRGVQAVLTCNGLFTSGRSLEQVFDQELAYMGPHLGTADGGDYRVDEDLRAVEIGKESNPPVLRAAFREGIGCVVLAPGQGLEDIAQLPAIDIPPPAQDPSTLAWPDGDLLTAAPLPDNVDAATLQAASDWAFERESPEQVTLSLLVVVDGRIVHERYAPGVTMDTRTRTWSTAKSIAATLLGILVDRGDLSLDEPLPIDWLPEMPLSEEDPRRAITLRHVLNMSSGLYPVDSFGREYADGSGLAYWAGASSAVGARSRGLVRAPGTSWDYENYDTLLAVYAMKQALGSAKAYHRFPYEALLGRIGMHNTLLSTDRFGDFVLSSQVYTNARDLARFGLLYLHGGSWNGKRILSEEWIEFVRTPAPASALRGHDYGGQWWLVPDDRDDVPRDAYATAGNRGQYVIVVPSHDTVIVRRGLDYGEQGFNRWDLAREVLKAIR